MKSLILLVLVAAVIYYIWTHRGGRRDKNVNDIPWVEKDIGDDAMRILRERYAKGEIDLETYEKMKKELQ